MKSNTIIAFILGAGIGSAVTWKLLDEKLDKKHSMRADAEIDSVKESLAQFKPTNTNEEEQSKIAEQAMHKADIATYAKELQEHGYIDYSEMSEKPSKNLEETVDEPAAKSYAEDDVEQPYVIPPEEFGEFDDYHTIELTYYTDGVLTDDQDELVEDVDDIVGEDFASHFGEYEDDSVFIRNDRLRCDYQILLDSRKYSDVVEKRPHSVED